MADLNNEKVKANVKHQKRKQEMKNPFDKKKRKKNQIIYFFKPTYLPINKLKNIKTNENQRSSHK